jgi:hypothetical protein
MLAEITTDLDLTEDIISPDGSNFLLKDWLNKTINKLNKAFTL